MHRLVLSVLCCILAALPVNSLYAQRSAISREEAEAWMMRLIPLPKSVEIAGTAVVARDRVKIIPPEESGPVIEQACKELRETAGLPENGKTSGEPAFTITLQLGGSESEVLKELKNSEQAYRIFPEENDTGLRLAALSPRGLYYAAKTLQQLIRARSTSETVEIPILQVTDWPDMEDRGLWGTDSYDHLRWLADRKMNIMEQISTVGVDKEGRPFAGLKDHHKALIGEGPRYGIKPVPVVLHLEQLKGKGIFDAYPNLKGKSEHEGVICYSQPEFVDILAEWIVQFASLPHVNEVDVWMTENLSQKGGCRCEKCKSEDYNVLEARAVIKAWEKARETIPGVGIYMLTSEETESSNRRIFRELPPEIKVWYYHSLITYNSRKSPLLWRDYLTDFARSGRWLGVCPNLDATVHWTSPFTGPHFVHYRMNEFVDKQVSGLIGYATPRVNYSRFNVEAAAEWSWNAKGRSPREFALSWAVREGIEDPEEFAEWADAVGQVEWAVYGSHWPSGEGRSTPGPAAERLREGTLPDLGFVLWDAFTHPFGDVKSAEELNSLVAAGEKAVRLAEEMGIPEFIHESMIAQGYINSLKALWELKQLVRPDGIAEKDKEAAGRYFNMYADSLKQSAEALPKWEACVSRQSDPRSFTDKPVGAINKMIEDMQEVAAGFGLDTDAQ